MRTLLALVSPFAAIAAHRAGPQHLPRSAFLLALVIVVHFLVYLLGMKVLGTPAPRFFVLPLLDTVAQAGFFALLLSAAGFRDRLTQTLTAVFGADALLNVLSVILAMASNASGEAAVGILPAIAALVVMLWSLGVKGHILMHAAGFPYFVGVSLALGMFVFVIAVDYSIFGPPA